MHCRASSAAVDLLPAAETIGNDESLREGPANGGQQDQLSDLHAYRMVLRLVPEGARMAAASYLRLLQLKTHVRIACQDVRLFHCGALVAGAACGTVT